MWINACCDCLAVVKLRSGGENVASGMSQYFLPAKKHTMTKQEAAQAYAAKKLCEIIESLAVQEGDARSRIMHAQTLIMPIKDSDFPPHLLDDWRWVKAQMSRLDPMIENGNGTMFRISDKAATSVMRNATAKKVAQRIWYLYWKISQNRVDR